MIFWRVSKINKIFQFKYLDTMGSHKWKGGMLNFISNAKIIVKIKKLLIMKILFKIIHKMIGKEAKIWIKK